MDQLLQFVQGIHPILLNSFTFLAGLLIGHWIQLGRDKRQEYNDIVKPLRATFVEFAENPTPYLHWDTVQMDLLEHYVGWWKKSRLRKALNRLEGCCLQQTEQDEAGQLVLRDRAAVAGRARELLRLLPLR